MALDQIEQWINWIGVIVGLATLALALWQGVWQGLRRPLAGPMTGAAAKVLRAPVQLLIGALWIGLCAVLWRPIPLPLSAPARVAALGSGGLAYFLGLALYLWGARTLGEMYRPSSAFGAPLTAGHRLVTHGPFAWVRHPMYLGLQVAALGGLLLFRTWTMSFVALNFLALIIRAKREEQSLALEFGEQWQAYMRRVPAWIPRLPRPAG